MQTQCQSHLCWQRLVFWMPSLDATEEPETISSFSLLPSAKLYLTRADATQCNLSGFRKRIWHAQSPTFLARDCPPSPQRRMLAPRRVRVSDTLSETRSRSIRRAAQRGLYSAPNLSKLQTATPCEVGFKYVQRGGRLLIERATIASSWRTAWVRSRVPRSC